MSWEVTLNSSKSVSDQSAFPLKILIEQMICRRNCQKRLFHCCRLDFDRAAIFADINPCKKYNQQIIIRFHPFLIRI